jgi:hypothetical protein
MSNPEPGGSARKSAAIIPFVNESLTSGLPIGSTPKRLQIQYFCKQLAAQSASRQLSA